jgi:hypothetical protein
VTVTAGLNSGEFSYDPWRLVSPATVRDLLSPLAAEHRSLSGGLAMKKILLISVCLLAVGGFSRPGDAQTPKALENLMMQKLKSAQGVLEGLALADFPKISRSAEELIQLTKTEEWLVIKTPRYQMHSNEFRRAVETVLRKARDKNLDGTALAYFDMTMSCVRCHQYVREVREARLPARPGQPLVQE